MGWEHYQAVDPPKESPGLVGDCLMFIYQLVFTSNSIKSSAFHIFLSLTYPLGEKKMFLSQDAQKSPKYVLKTAKQWSI